MPGKYLTREPHPAHKAAQTSLAETFTARRLPEHCRGVSNHLRYLEFLYPLLAQEIVGFGPPRNRQPTHPKSQSPQEVERLVPCPLW